jgi:hypothetical protein
MTAVQSERSAALATLFTVHVARLAVSVLDAVLLLGMATAAATRDARRTKVMSEGMGGYLNLRFAWPPWLPNPFII